MRGQPLFLLRTRITPSRPTTCLRLPPVPKSQWRHYSSQFTRQASRDREAVGVFTPKAALLLVVTGAGLLFYFDREKKRINEEKEKAKANATYGRPDVGGPFQMIDHNNKPFSEKDLLGSYSLVYFGFTNCPDICPDELDKMSAVVSAIEKTLPEGSPLRYVKPIFVSVDPARDSVEQVRRYVQDFHPRLVGLTGTYDAVKAMCKAYRVYFSSPPPKEGETSLGQDYLVDHSIYFYLMDPEGLFVQAFGKSSTAEEVTERVLQEIENWNKGQRAEERYAHQIRK